MVLTSIRSLLTAVKDIQSETVAENIVIARLFKESWRIKRLQQDVEMRANYRKGES